MAESKLVKKPKNGVVRRGKRVVRAQAPDYRSVYVNNVQVSLSFFDVSVFLGQVTHVTDDEVRVVDQFSIHMSPEHANSFHRLLGKQLELYRTSFGDLRPEPSIGESEPEDR